MRRESSRSFKLQSVKTMDARGVFFVQHSSTRTESSFNMTRVFSSGGPREASHQSLFLRNSRGMPRSSRRASVVLPVCLSLSKRVGGMHLASSSGGTFSITSARDGMYLPNSCSESLPISSAREGTGSSVTSSAGAVSAAGAASGGLSAASVSSSCNAPRRVIKAARALRCMDVGGVSFIIKHAPRHDTSARFSCCCIHNRGTGKGM